MLAGTTNLRRLDQVEHFWDTVDTIGEGFGFSLFGRRIFFNNRFRSNTMTKHINCD